VQVLVHRPDPRVVAFTLVFLLAFVASACVVGGVTRLVLG